MSSGPGRRRASSKRASATAPIKTAITPTIAAADGPSKPSSFVLFEKP
jgi:hypothetical protein